LQSTPAHCTNILYTKRNCFFPSPKLYFILSNVIFPVSPPSIFLIWCRSRIIGNILQEGVQGELGPETQGGPLAPCRHRSADHHLRILSMVTWLQTASAKKKLRKVKKTGMLRDNRSDSYDSHRCYGGARLTPSAGSGDTRRGDFGGTPPLEFGVLVLPSPPTRS
jgi:hypothetical protein